MIPERRDTELAVIHIDVNLKTWENLRLFRGMVFCEKNKRRQRNRGPVLGDGRQQRKERWDRGGSIYRAKAGPATYL